MSLSRTPVRAARKGRLAAANGNDDKGVVIARVLVEVQGALQRARARTQGTGFPKFETATITLQTVITRSLGGKIKFLIFSFGKTWERERSHEMVLSLTPPPVPAARTAMVDRTLAQDLEDAIVEAAEGVRNAGTGDPPLSLSTFKITVSFVVTEDVSGGADFSISPVTFELKGDLKRKAIHSIALGFKR
jgi:hypothetical protein